VIIACESITTGSELETKRKKRKEFVHIGSVVHNVMRTYRNDNDAGLMQVWQVWNRIVGDAVAQNAQPAAFKGNLLLVHVSSSPWIQQLQFLKQDIISKLNQALVKESVKEIKFKIGPLT
jgi:predicted nucleic acid-binding Zn ribbon protein